jgi:adenylate kinase family enzyme
LTKRFFYFHSSLQEITIELLKDAMLEHPDSRGFLVDGFPRELEQGHQFEQEVVCDF